MEAWLTISLSQGSEAHYRVQCLEEIITVGQGVGFERILRVEGTREV